MPDSLVVKQEIAPLRHVHVFDDLHRLIDCLFGGVLCREAPLGPVQRGVRANLLEQLVHPLFVFELIFGRAGPC